jgi:Flp pilus assembly protein CpaB
VSRRRRSLAFTLAALAAAALAATLAQRYGSSVARGYGTLRPVVVTRRDLPTKQLGARTIASGLVLRQVPDRFAPPDALASPQEALGLVPAVPLPSGTYLLASELRPPRSRRPATRRLGAKRAPVELTISGAGALLGSGPAPVGSRVEVVVSGSAVSGPGRTRIAASAVPLLELRPGSEAGGPEATAAATLGLTRRQALRLIAAESEARRITLLPGR